MVAIAAQRTALASRYALEAPNGALFTADPGTTGSATTEVPATGSPAYARKALTGNWATGTASAGAISGSATFDVPAGTTITHFGPTVGAVRATADVRDVVAVTNQPFASQGTYTITPTYTQS